MQVLPSRVDLRSEEYASNRAAMLAALDELSGLHQRAVAGGGERAVAKLRSRGKLLPRERIGLLLDRDSPFLELSALAGHGSDEPLGAGIVSGIGVICGTECVVIANDPTV